MVCEYKENYYIYFMFDHNKELIIIILSISFTMAYSIKLLNLNYVSHNRWLSAFIIRVHAYTTRRCVIKF